MLKKRLYFSLGWLSLFAGVVGIFLPLLPTTPFVLLSAFCFSRSSPRFYGWLTANPYLNSYIENHRSGCGVPAKIVWRALAFLWAGLLLSAYCLKNPWFWLFLSLVGIFVSAHLLQLRRVDRAPLRFTLLELLVSMGIIAVLGSLLLPALQRARNQAALAVCAGNQSQIGLGLELYCADNEDHIPDIGNKYLSESIPVIRMPMGGPLGMAFALGKLVEQYQIPAASFGCPGSAGFKPADLRQAWSVPGVVRSAYIYRETDAGFQPQISHMRNSGKAVLMDFACIPYSGEMIVPHEFKHVNILYADGHVERRRNSPAKAAFYTTWTEDSGESTATKTPQCEFIWEHADAH